MRIKPADLKVGMRYTRNGGGQMTKDFEVIDANSTDLKVEDLGSTQTYSVSRYALRNYQLELLMEAEDDD